MVLILLIIISIWDLFKKEIPVPLLIMFSIAAATEILVGDVASKVAACLLTVWLAGVGTMLVHKKKMGGGDVWVLVCLAVAWPLELFWNSVIMGTMILCIVAMGILFLNKNENIQLPMVPFLLLGYCVRG